MLCNRFTPSPEPRSALRRRQAIRSQLNRLAYALNQQGKFQAPITAPCTFVDLCKLGLPRALDGHFVFGTHPVLAVGQ